MRNAKSRAQSAMEYLMTYGWAIIIILVVLSILYVLGVFTPGSFVGTTCSTPATYSCKTATLSTNGKLSFLFGQNTGSTEYNLAFACTAAANLTSGQPYSSVGNPWEYLNSTGSLSESYNASNYYILYTGGTIQINGLICFDQNGAALDENLTVQVPTLEFASTTIPTTAIATGTPFTGNIWVEYTNNIGSPSGTNPYVAVEFASLTTRSASS